MNATLERKPVTLALFDTPEPVVVAGYTQTSLLAAPKTITEADIRSFVDPIAEYGATHYMTQIIDGETEITIYFGNWKIVTLAATATELGEQQAAILADLQRMFAAVTA